MKARWIARLTCAGGLVLVSPHSHAQEDVAGRAQPLIAGLDYDQARRELAAANPDDPSVALERARLAIYELDCDGAVTILGRPELQRSEAGERLADIARGCQRVIAIRLRLLQRCA